jgi:hypothetical protein
MNKSCLSDEEMARKKLKKGLAKMRVRKTPIVKIGMEYKDGKH